VDNYRGKARVMSLLRRMYRIEHLVLTTAVVLAGQSYGADRALLIGINDYQSDLIPDLVGTHNDVAAVEQLLSSYWGVSKQDIRVVRDGEATRQGILDSIDEWLVKGTDAGDRVFFYYSGHGFQTKDQEGGDEADGMDETLVPNDTRIEGRSITGMITDDEIADRLSALTDRRTMVIVDSCHSGTVTRSLIRTEAAKTLPPDILSSSTRSLFTSKGELAADGAAHQKEGNFVKTDGQEVALFAVSAMQEAIEDRSDPSFVTGVFTSALSRGLVNLEADADNNERVTYAELVDYLQNESDSFCERRPGQCPRGLTPQISIAHEKLAEDVKHFGRPNDDNPTTMDSEVPGEVLAHTNEANLQLRIEPGNKVGLGQEIRYRVWSDKPGWLLLFDVNANGEATQLYPNKFSVGGAEKPMEIRADREIVIPDAYMPFRLRASEPLGPGKLVAVLVEDAIAESDTAFTDSTRGFTTVEQPRDWMTDLRERLNRLVHQADGTNRRVRWSVATADYTVVR